MLNKQVCSCDGSVGSSGVRVVTAPVSVTAHFKEPLLVPGKVLITFWEAIRDNEQSAAEELRFHVQQPGQRVSHMVGRVSRF